MKIDGDVFIREKIDLNYTIIVKELKQELKQNRVELPQPPLKTNLERTIYDTCLMPRTKGDADQMFTNANINKGLKQLEDTSLDDNIIQELAKGGLELPPISDNEDAEVKEKWIYARNRNEEKEAIKELWRGWYARHPGEIIDWSPEYVKDLEADGLSPTASGKEGKDLPGFSSEEFPSSIHPVEEEEASAEAPWSLKELLEEDSFTISSIGPMEEEESVGVMPNLSEDDGEMSAPTSSRDNREMSAPTASRDNREMSAPIVSRNIEEMSALNIPDATWWAAIKGACQANIHARKRIIAEVLKPQFVMPSIGTKEWRCLEVIIHQERKRYTVLRRLSPDAKTREDAQRMKGILDDFSRTKGCGAFKNTLTKEKKLYLKTLLNAI